MALTDPSLKAELIAESGYWARMWNLGYGSRALDGDSAPESPPCVTVFSTVEIEENFTSMGLSNFAISFLSDDIVRLRYVSINGQLRKMLVVVKMRGGPHSIDMWEYTITSRGMVIGERLRGYRGLTTGVPGPWSIESGQNDPSPVGVRLTSSPEGEGEHHG